MAHSPDAIQSAFGRDEKVRFQTSPLGGTVARLQYGRHEAVIALQGAQVLSWRHGPRELLWLSPLARLGTGKAVRGGIPVCWPWFASHPTDNDKPAHGFMRTRDWTVHSSEASDSGTTVTLGVETTEADRSLWPHSAAVEVTVTLGETLSLVLATRNTGATPFELTQALHTYFRIHDIGGIEIEGLDGRTYLDKLDDYARKVQSGPITIDREVDRIYLGDTAAISLVERDSKRHIDISSEGSRSAVVWNPWAEKTARLGDMGSDNAFRRMVCIETTNAGDDVIRLKPGEAHRMRTCYRAG